MIERQLLSLCTDVLEKNKKAISLKKKKKKHKPNQKTKTPQSYYKIKSVVVMAIDEKGEKDQVAKLFSQYVTWTALYRQVFAFPYPSFSHSRKLILAAFPQYIPNLEGYNKLNP